MPAEPVRKALCIGIDDYPTHKLRGCVNDAKAWQSFLNDIGFSVSLLLHPKRQEILQGIDDLFRDAKAGDLLVLQYSGHGTRIENPTTGGFDEALCPVDFDQGYLILDDEIGAKIETLSDYVRLTCFFDCCHASTMTNLFATSRQLSATRKRARYIRLNQSIRNKAKRFLRTARNTVQSNDQPLHGNVSGKEVVFSACGSLQLAWESDVQGIFTEAALEAAKLAYDANETNEEFHQRVVNKMQGDASAASQQARMYCGVDEQGSTLRRAPFLRPATTGNAPNVQPLGTTGSVSNVQPLWSSWVQKNFPEPADDPEQRRCDIRVPKSQTGIGRKRHRNLPTLIREPDFDIDYRQVIRAAQSKGRRRRFGDPEFREVQVQLIDPWLCDSASSVNTLCVPWEPLTVSEAGLSGTFLKVVAESNTQTGSSGCVPSRDAILHFQTVYALCARSYSAFREALGRNPAWGFQRESDDRRLLIRPHIPDERNAWYDDVQGELCFGWFTSSHRGTDPVYHCLSHDVAIHEMTHALLDGLKPGLKLHLHPDVLAIHEALADVAALLMRFEVPAFARSVIRRPGLLNGRALATSFASHLEKERARIRHASAKGEKLAHQRAIPLVMAILDALTTVVERCKLRSEKVVPVINAGTRDVARQGEKSSARAGWEMQADMMSRLAKRFWRWCVRSLEYCPPVQVTFGHLLRAMITVDLEEHSEDRFGCRQTLIESFQRHGLVPLTGEHSSSSFGWPTTNGPVSPAVLLPCCHLLAAGKNASKREWLMCAKAVGRFVTGLAADLVAGDGRVTVLSVWPRKRYDHGRPVHDLVAEVVRTTVPWDDDPAAGTVTGATLVFDATANLRYVIPG